MLGLCSVSDLLTSVRVGTIMRCTVHAPAAHVGEITRVLRTLCKPQCRPRAAGLDPAGSAHVVFEKSFNKRTHFSLSPANF